MDRFQPNPRDDWSREPIMSVHTIPSVGKLAYSLKEASAVTGVSVDELRRCIHATDGSALYAKRIGARGGRYLIEHNELVRWLAALPDA